MQTRITPKNDTFHTVMMTAVACLKNTVFLKILDHCNWHPETMMVSALNDGVCAKMYGAASGPLETIPLK